FSIFYTPEDIQRGHPQEELRIAQTQGKYEEEGWRVRKDGSRFWADVTIALLKSNVNVGFAKITRDMTGRKHAEDEIRTARNFLEVRVVERTRELEKAIKVREDVLKIVSHDLKTPLAAVHLNANLLLRSVDQGASKEIIHAQVERIIRATDRMDRLIV